MCVCARVCAHMCMHVCAHVGVHVLWYTCGDQRAYVDVSPHLPPCVGQGLMLSARQPGPQASRQSVSLLPIFSEEDFPSPRRITGWQTCTAPCLSLCEVLMLTWQVPYPVGHLPSSARRTLMTPF